jgi:hypothetical protein
MELAAGGGFNGHPLRRFLVYPCFGLKKEAVANLNNPDLQDTG